MDAINTALSGLKSAQTRIAVSADNIANVNSTTRVEDGKAVNSPYVPQVAVPQSQGTGGVSTSIQDVSPPSVPVFDPDSPVAAEDGTVQIPNVSLEQEVANNVLAANTYKANLAVIRRAEETYDSLLDIQS